MAQRGRPRKVVDVPLVDKREIEARDAEMDAQAAAKVAQQVASKVAEEQAVKAEQLRQWSDTDDGPPLNSVPAMFKPIDHTEFPELVHIKGEGQRRLKLPYEMYRWVRFMGKLPNVPTARIKGWDFVPGDRFKDTGFFHVDVHNHVVNGDCVLMYISADGHRRLKEQIEAMKNMRERMVLDRFHSEAETLSRQSGYDIPTEETIDGRTHRS